MLMTKSEYAKHRGVSRQTVYKWIESGELVMDGKKIDVEATERRQSGAKAGYSDGKDDDNGSGDSSDLWPERTLAMKWRDFWRSVLDYDGKATSPVTEEDAEKRVEIAAREMGYDVGLLEEDGFYLTDGDSDHYFYGYGVRENARLVILFLRRELCYAAAEDPDEVDDWSPEGMKALALEKRHD